MKIHIDNPNPTNSVNLTGVQGTIGKGEAWIAELHVWQGGDKPIISETWTNQP